MRCRFSGESHILRSENSLQTVFFHPASSQVVTSRSSAPTQVYFATYIDRPLPRDASRPPPSLGSILQRCIPPSRFISRCRLLPPFLAVSFASLPRHPLRRRKMNTFEPIEPQLAQRPRDRKRKSEVSRCGCVEERSRGLRCGASNNQISLESTSERDRV
jgi:hypothetical protein